VRVVTLNVWAHGGDWPSRLEVIQSGMRELAPDLVSLNETIVRDGYDQAAEILGDELHYLHQRKRNADGIGTSIASRWPIRSSREIDLRITAPSSDFFAGALVAEIDVPAPVGRVVFVNHNPSFEVDFTRERELQAVIVARAVESVAPDLGQHAIVAGDMDADPQSSSIRFWTGRQSLDGVSVCYRDAWERIHPHEPGETFTPDENPLVQDPDWPFRRIDYILVRCDRHDGPTLEIRSCERVFDQPVDGVWASDHFGVMADLEPHGA